MMILKTSLMNYLDADTYGGFSMLDADAQRKVKEAYGESALQKIKDCGLYRIEEYDGALMKGGYYLSFNLVDWEMPGVISDYEFRDHILQYMKEMDMLPMTRTLDELYNYFMEIVLPKFVAAGLLETL